jgi:FkbM family methyltransferase
MTLHRTLRTSKDHVINIDSDDADVIEHFADKTSCAEIVLDMFNNDRFYDDFFKGWDDLTILDIGGNIGLFSLYIQDRAKAVYTLEPTPAHFSILKTLTSNYPNIHPLNIALHNEDATIDFYISENNSTMNSTVNQYGKKIPVTGKTLHSIISDLNLSKVDFVKCDIEGSEMAALTNETISAVKDIVSVWSIEVHATDPNIHPEVSINRNRDHIMQILKKNGYNAFKHRYDAVYAYKV